MHITDVSPWDLGQLPNVSIAKSMALEAFNKRFALVVESREVFDILTGDRMSIPDFKNLFVDQRYQLSEENPRTKPTTDAWLEWPDKQRYYRYTYVPGEDSFFNDCVNLWRNISPSPAKGDVRLWTALEDHIFCDLSEDEKHWLRCWAAYPLQHPGTKLRTAVLIHDPVGGIGKGIYTETLKLLYGKHSNDSFSNACTINNQQLRSAFNGWIARKQLVVCDEITVPYAEREVVADRMKSLISEETVTVNQKYAREINLPNYANFIITSNSPAAIRIDDGDRRYFVVSSTAEPFDGNDPGSLSNRFIQWRDYEPDPNDEDDIAPGLNAIMYHMLHMDLTGFNPNARAPLTRAKSEIIENVSPAHEIWLRDLKEDSSRYGDLVTAEELFRDFRNQHSDSSISLNQFTTAMTKVGFSQVSKSQIRTNDGKKRLRLLRDAAKYRKMTDAEIGRAYDTQVRSTPIPRTWSDIDLSQL